MLRRGLIALSLLTVSAPALAQPVFQRTPNLEGTDVTPEWTGDFSFTHRFLVAGGKVSNFPTFFVGLGLPFELALAGRYASNAETVAGQFNEGELFLKKGLLHEDAHFVDLGVALGYNFTANSADGELSLGRSIGPVRLLATTRAFSNGFGKNSLVVGAGAGANVRIFPHLALAGDVFQTLNQANPLGWGVGLQAELPYSPHTVALQVTNVNSVTHQGASIGTGSIRYGFEFSLALNNATRWLMIFQEPEAIEEESNEEEDSAEEMDD